MTMFDPFESDRSREQLNCICGRHRSQAEHDYAARLTLECAPVDDGAAREGERFAGVVAQRAMRSAFGRPPRR
jgi:nitrate/nitrite transport system substrate-binding protein